MHMQNLLRCNLKSIYLIFWHKLVFGCLQNLHSPHCGMYRGMTVSPEGPNKISCLSLYISGLIQEKIRRTWLKLGNSLPDTLHHAGALMAQNYREDPLRIGATESVGVGVTDPCSHDLKIKASNLMFSFSWLGTSVCVYACLSVFAGGSSTPGHGRPDIDGASSKPR